MALVWAREGARIVVSDMNRAGDEEIVALVLTQGGEAISLASEVGQPNDAKSLVEQTVAHFGRLDVACQNAVIGSQSAPIAEYPVDGGYLAR